MIVLSYVLSVKFDYGDNNNEIDDNDEDGYDNDDYDEDE